MSWQASSWQSPRCARERLLVRDQADDADHAAGKGDVAQIFSRRSCTPRARPGRSSPSSSPGAKGFSPAGFGVSGSSSSRRQPRRCPSVLSSKNSSASSTSVVVSSADQSWWVALYTPASSAGSMTSSRASLGQTEPRSGQPKARSAWPPACRRCTACRSRCLRRRRSGRRLRWRLRLPETGHRRGRGRRSEPSDMLMMSTWSVGDAVAIRVEGVVHGQQQRDAAAGGGDR